MDRGWVMTDGQTTDEEQAPPSPPRRSSLIWVLAVAVVLLIGLNIVLVVLLVRERDQQSARELCDSLDLPSGDGAEAADVTVFFALDRDEDDAAALADELESRDEVESVEVWDRDDAYEEFRDLFADAPEIVETTTAEMLPVQIRIEVVDDDLSAMDSLADELKTRDGVDDAFVATGSSTLAAACLDT